MPMPSDLAKKYCREHTYNHKHTTPAQWRDCQAAVAYDAGLSKARELVVLPALLVEIDYGDWQEGAKVRGESPYGAMEGVLQRNHPGEWMIVLFTSEDSRRTVSIPAAACTKVYLLEKAPDPDAERIRVFKEWNYGPALVPEDDDIRALLRRLDAVKKS